MDVFITSFYQSALSYNIANSLFNSQRYSIHIKLTLGMCSIIQSLIATFHLYYGMNNTRASLYRRVGLMRAAATADASGDASSTCFLFIFSLSFIINTFTNQTTQEGNIVL